MSLHRDLAVVGLAAAASFIGSIAVADGFDPWRDFSDGEALVIAARPGSPTIAPQEPDWCDGYTSQHKYGSGAMNTIILSFQNNVGVPDEAAIAALAESACDLRSDHKSYQARKLWVAWARQLWTNQDGSSAAEQRQYLRYFIAHRADAEAQAKELCARPAVASKDPLELAADKVSRIELQCDPAPRNGEYTLDEFLYWEDTPGYEPPALLRLVAAEYCVAVIEGPDRAYCAYDLARVDLARVDAEAAPLNERGRLRIHFAAAMHKRNLDKQAKPPAESTKEIARKWQQLYAANQATIDHATAIERSVFLAGATPAAEDCTAVRTALQAILAGPAQSLEEVESRFSSPVEWYVRESSALCDSALERPGLQAVRRSVAYPPRGPRSLALLLEGTHDVHAQTPRWAMRPPEPNRKLSPLPGPVWGVVGSTRRSGEYLVIKFAKVTQPFEIFSNCKDTGRISGIDDHWNVRYGVHCDSAMKNLDVTPDPVRVLAEYGAGIQAGVLLGYMPFTDDRAFPAAVLGGPRKKTLLAADGFPVGKARR